MKTTIATIALAAHLTATPQQETDTMLTHNIEAFRLRIAEHAAADLFIGDEYYNRDTGQACFIGCHVQSNDPGKIADIYGIPVALTRIAENIFKAMPTTKDKTDFAVAFGDAVGRDGKDLSLVHWAFLAAELRAIPKTTDAVQAVIDPVIEGVDLLASGQEWPAHVARAAYAAAYVVAADAAAHAAARLRQRNTLIALCNAA